MFRWLANWLQQRDAKDYLLKLSGMDGDEIGGVIALATHMRNRLLEGEGCDLFTPYNATFDDPGLVFTLSSTAKGFQRQGFVGSVNAAALILWVHTLRATLHPNLRPTVRGIWKEASRGFHHIEAGANAIEELTGEQLDIKDAGRFPDGFSPEPL